MSDLADLLAPRIAGWAAAHGPGLVVGLSGPQGCGKSTAARGIAERLAERGLRFAVLGLDDLYLTLRERRRLSRDVHPLLATRGPPGTHDAELGLELLHALRRPGAVRLPRFDKRRDDRAAEPDVFGGPADGVLFEGWCVGVPAGSSEAAGPLNALEQEEDADGRWRAQVEAALAGSYARLWAACDRLIALTAPGWDAVVRWRAQAETDNGAMDAPALERFMQHYQRLTLRAARDLPAIADLHVELGPDRRPLRLLSRDDPGRRLPEPARTPRSRS